MDSFMNIANNVENVIKDGEGGLGSVLDKNIGIFLDCKEIAGQQVIQGIYIIYFPRLQGDSRTTNYTGIYIIYFPRLQGDSRTTSYTGIYIIYFPRLQEDSRTTGYTGDIYYIFS